jgi:hypothetical protein
MMLLAGVPATGKSYFGEWLEGEHGVLHLDIERPGVLQKAGLAQPLERLVNRLDAGPFIARLSELGGHVLVNWGYPADGGEWIEALLARGVEPWWFDAEPRVAQEAFARRGTGDLANFDSQMAAILRNRDSVERLFGSHRIKTLRDDGSRMSPEEILERMKSHRANQGEG